MRKRCPAWVPGGIRSFTGPSNDGTSTRVPSAASWTATGTPHEQVVPFAPEEGAAGPGRDVEITVARRRAGPRGRARGRAAARRRRHPRESRPAYRRCEHRARGRRTSRTAAALATGAAARGARLREHHVPARPADVAAALALRAPPLRCADRCPRPPHARTTPAASPPPAARRRASRPRTRPSRAAWRSAPGCVSPRSAAGTGCSASANSSLNVAACAPCAATEKSNPRTRTSRRRRSTACRPGLVVVPPAFRVDQRFVRLGDPLEQRRRGAVPRIDARVIPPRQPPIRALDVRRARARRQAEEGVEIHVNLETGELGLGDLGISNLPDSDYFFSSSTTSASMTSPPDASGRPTLPATTRGTAAGPAAG